MKKFIVCLMLVCGTVLGQGNVTPEALNEINRRGNYVEMVDGINQGPNPITEAMKPPADSNHKWFISLITTNNCAACDRLKYDIANHKDLRAWINTVDSNKSFTHFNIYRYEDKTQNWRFSNIRFKAFPTILIQPPLNKRYGDPGTIVAQITGYDGDAKKLSDTIRFKMTEYVDAIQRKGTVTGFNQVDANSIGQRRPMPDFLPPDQMPLIPPELENPIPHIIPLADGGVIEGLKQVGYGIFNIFSGTVGNSILHTILLIVIVILFILQMKKSAGPTEKKEDNKNVQ